jgi:hypothetical protein
VIKGDSVSLKSERYILIAICATYVEECVKYLSDGIEGTGDGQDTLVCSGDHLRDGDLGSRLLTDLADILARLSNNHSGILG